ncbi:MAG: hypothetical protein ACYSWR_06750, partial [Planctomycetota bacterium]
MNIRRENCLVGGHFAVRYKVAALLLWLIIVGGCAERQFVNSTPQMDAAERFWVRVLLLDNVTWCTVTAPSAFNVI